MYEYVHGLIARKLKINTFWRDIGRFLVIKRSQSSSIPRIIYHNGKNIEPEYKRVI